MKSRFSYYIIVFLLTLLAKVGICFGQNNSLKSIELSIDKVQSKKSLQNLSKINIKDFSSEEIGFYYYLLAKVYFKENQDDKALKNYLLAKKYYKKGNNLDKAIDVNLDIAFCIHKHLGNKNKHNYYLEEYIEFAKKTKNYPKLLKGFVQIASLKINEKEAQESLFYFRKAIQLNKKLKDKKLESKIYNNISVLFSDVLIKPDSGLYYLKKDLILLESDEKPNNSYICYNLINQASNYRHLLQYQQAIQFLNQSNKIQLIDNLKETKENINLFLSLNFKDAKNPEKALYHLEIANQYHDSLNVEEQNKVVNELDAKYKTQEKELENLRLKNKIKTNKLLIYACIALVVILFIISVLVYNNIIKKKRIAEQQKQLKIIELEKVLKEQELNGIDLMLESQEKERQNIANELHDNLGSMLATLKLNFQNLKRQQEAVNQQEAKLYDKTDALLEEAYQKVRNIAHLKNLGVIGNEGLLVAVNKMAEKMTVIEKLKINVIPFGLNERLDNTIEVTLFRMIQELCTNIIKHSEASEVNIYLTQSSTTEMNVIIEDNGRGFDPKVIETQSGIGLKNMQKKVEQMGGTFSIDSILTKGTTIIIDLPL